MSHNVHVSTPGRNAMLNGFAPLCNSGTIKFYSGSQPVDGDTALSGNTLLATLTFGATAFGSASGAAANANAIGSAVIAASGTCTFARVLESDGTTKVVDCSVDISSNNPDVVVPTTTFTAGVTLSMSSLIISLAA